ncbi:extracellular solute-binding protein [Paenibacillus sp. GCM10023252]|uniref:extracellular solute-binding protein n=1 Tax=Paenibacillus sp. GCM10023252 TaxID=3252649 RepID=UPI00361ADE29
MNNKVFKLLTLCLLVCVLLSACSGGNNSGSKQENNNGGAGTEGASEGEGKTEEEEVTLKFYFGGDKKSATDEVWSEVSKYVKEKGLNVKFEISTIPFGDYKQKMIVMSASGDDWDANFDGDWLAYQQMAAKGAYMPLNDLLPEHAPNLYKVLQEQGTLKAATVGGNIVALPWSMKMNARPFVRWRSDLTEKAGLTQAKDSIKTVEELDAFAQKLKQAYPDTKIGFPANNTVLLSFFTLRDELYDLRSHGLHVSLQDSTYKVTPIEQTQTYRDAVTFAKKWFDSGIINKDVLVDKQDPGSLYMNGKILLANTSHEWANANQPFADATWKNETSMLYPDKKYANRTALANVFAINKNSKHADRVLRFLDMLETDAKLYDLVQYGIEGKNYVLDGKTANYPQGMDTSTSNYMEWGGQWALWKPQFMRPNSTYSEGFWVREAEFASESQNVNSPLDGLFITEDAIKTEAAGVDQVYDEFGRSLEVGAVKNVDEEINKYIEKRKKAGIDKVAAEAQKQLNAFLEASK